VLALGNKILPLEEKQAAAACGQIALAGSWRDAFLPHGIHAAQVLLTADDSKERRRYLNARATLMTLLELGAVPIINENDTVATAELKVGDNDRLSARVAEMVSADVLVLLSDIDGLYTADPRGDATAKFIPEVRGGITPAIEAYAGGAGSAVGTGGMETKIQAAKIALGAGCHMVIARGEAEHALKKLVAGGTHTRFVAEVSPLNAKKRWIAGMLSTPGAFVLDAGATTALEEGKSLLPAGVKAVEGAFERGDAVLIKATDGRIIGKGLTAYSSADAERIRGRKTSEVEGILGFKGRSSLIHRDDMVLNG
jgi:glutamate 5-kinase